MRKIKKEKREKERQSHLNLIKAFSKDYSVQFCLEGGIWNSKLESVIEGKLK